LGLAEEGVVKFGFTNGLRVRVQQHKREIGPQFTLCYIIESIYNREIETMIKNNLDDKIIKKTYPGREAQQKELIQLTNDFTIFKLYETVLLFRDSFNDGQMITKLMEQYEELKKENENLKAKIYSPEELKIKEIDSLKQLAESNEKLIESNEKLAEVKKGELELRQKKFEKQTEVRIKVIKENECRYQIYNPKDLSLKHTYECMNDLVRETKLFEGALPQSVGRAIKNNIVYQKYRFWKLERNQEVRAYIIPPTYVPDRTVKLEQIIQVSTDYTKIINAFSNTHMAALDLFNKLVERQRLFPPEKLVIYDEKKIEQIQKSITNSLSDNPVAYEYRWFRYSECDKELIDTYLLDHEIPEYKSNKNQRMVFKFNLQKELIIKYDSMAEATKLENISDTTLRKNVKNKTVYNGCYWSFDEIFSEDEEELEENDQE